MACRNGLRGTRDALARDALWGTPWRVTLAKVLKTIADCAFVSTAAVAGIDFR
jgi:hypothetical protein